MREKPKLLYIVEAMGGGVFTLGRISYQENQSLFNHVVEAMLDVHFLRIDYVTGRMVA